MSRAIRRDAAAGSAKSSCTPASTTTHNMSAGVLRRARDSAGRDIELGRRSGGGHGEMTGRMLIAHRAGADRRAARLRCSSTATPTRRSPARWPPPSCTCRSRTSRPACDRSTARMPEEINRIVTDHVSSLLFCPTRDRGRQSAREGIDDGVHRVRRRDVRRVAVLRERAARALARAGLARPRSAGAFVLATCHRAENTDDPVHALRAIVDGPAEVSAARRWCCRCIRGPATRCGRASGRERCWPACASSSRVRSST